MAWGLLAASPLVLMSIVYPWATPVGHSYTVWEEVLLSALGFAFAGYIVVLVLALTSNAGVVLSEVGISLLHRRVLSRTY